MEMDNSVAAELALQCEICGMLDFHQEGGFYYCTTCNTQSQVILLYDFYLGEKYRNANIFAILCSIRDYL